MTELPFFFELSGEHPTLPESEAIACVRAECDRYTIGARGPGYLICNFPRGRADRIANRIALSHRIGRYLGSCLPDNFQEFINSIELPSGTISIRARKFQNCTPEVDTNQLVRKAAAVLTKDRKVDLVAPDVEVRILISDYLHFFISDYVIDRKQYDMRKVAFRPFFSPISLHPRYARAMINLAELHEGESILDPFCGTGGVLIEAGLIGAKIFGSDISPEMIKGCKENLQYFGINWERLEAIDVGRLHQYFDKIDAVVTDPPYGRSASTRKEDLKTLYNRTLDSICEVLNTGGRLCIIYPSPHNCTSERLKLLEVHKQKVHRSLSRNYCVFIKTH